MEIVHTIDFGEYQLHQCSNGMCLAEYLVDGIVQAATTCHTAAEAKYWISKMKKRERNLD